MHRAHFTRTIGASKSTPDLHKKPVVQMVTLTNGTVLDAGSVSNMPLTGTVVGSGEMLPYLLMIIILVISIGWPIIVQKKGLFKNRT